MDGKRTYCDCWQGQRERKLDEEQAETLRANRERTMTLCFRDCDEEVTGYTWDSYPADGDLDALARIRAFPATWDGKRGLITIGDIGTGKTVSMVCLFRELIPLVARLPRAIEMSNWRVRFAPMMNIINELRGAMNRPTASGEPGFSTVLDDYKDAYLLCIDDVGVEKLTPFVADQFYAIINDRTWRGLPTFMTSNLNLDELKAHLTPRVFSRLLPKVDILEMDSPDLRELAALKRLQGGK